MNDSLQSALKKLRLSGMSQTLEVRLQEAAGTLFPHEASCLRLVSAVLMELSEEWQSGKVYLNMNVKND